MTAQELIVRISDAIVEPLVALLFGVAFVIFIWGLVKYIQKSDSDADRKTGRNHIMWGLVGVVIMISAFGIINIIIGTIGAELPEGVNRDVIETTDQVGVQSDL